MDNNYLAADLLDISIHITTTPAFIFTGNQNGNLYIQEISDDSSTDFNIQVEAKLNYHLLAKTINEFIDNRRFDIREGIINMQAFFSNFTLSGSEDNRLKIEVDITGVFDGKAYLSGVPSYNASQQMLEIQNLQYELTTKNLLVKAAKWLFNKRIESELEKVTSYQLNEYYTLASQKINSLLNKEWTKGVTGTSTAQHITITKVFAFKDYLLLQANCKGNLSIQVDI